MPTMTTRKVTTEQRLNGVDGGSCEATDVAETLVCNVGGFAWLPSADVAAAACCAPSTLVIGGACATTLSCSFFLASKAW